MTLKPQFNRRCPENWRDFLRSDSDDQFKKEHPVAYPIFIALGLVILLAPMALFLLYLDALPGEPSLASVLLGFVGGGCLGVGLFNILAAFLGQYLGHKVTTNFVFWGVALLIIAGYLA